MSLIYKKNDVNHSLQSLFDSVNDLLKIHAPYKKVKKYKLKFKEKPWISSGIQKSISIKIYKNYRNIIATLMKKSKQKNYFTKHFESNMKNLKNTWKGVKKIISLKNSASKSPNLLNFNNELTSDPPKVPNIFNN